MEREFAIDATAEIINVFINKNGTPDYEEYINYIIDCCKNNRNVYVVANGQKIYSADYYSFEDYYLIVYGLKQDEQYALNSFANLNSISPEEKVKLNELITPAFEYLKNINKEEREQLIQGQNNQKLL